MITVPYVYRNGTSGSTSTVGELPGKICNVRQSIWMTARRNVLSGSTSAVAPCLSCVRTWVDQSVNAGYNSATLNNSARAVNFLPLYNADYWTGDTTNNFKSFVSFDAKISSTPPSDNRPNFLAVPFNSTFARLTAFTFSTIFRCRRISPNIVTKPDGVSGGNVVLFQNSSVTDGSRTDGWGIDIGTDELRIWGYDNTATFCNNFQGNSILFPILDWTKWMRLTVRVSGKTMQANLYSFTGKYQPSGSTWVNGCSNNNGSGIDYDTGIQDWFIASQRGPGYPTASGDQSILNGSWDMLEYVLYDNWLSDTCVSTIWNYYNTQYNI